jgi:hypothetical protein
MTSWWVEGIREAHAAGQLSEQPEDRKGSLMERTITLDLVVNVETEEELRQIKDAIERVVTAVLDGRSVAIQPSDGPGTDGGDR